MKKPQVNDFLQKTSFIVFPVRRRQSRSQHPDPCHLIPIRSKPTITLLSFHMSWSCIAVLLVAMQCCEHVTFLLQTNILYNATVIIKVFCFFMYNKWIEDWSCQYVWLLVGYVIDHTWHGMAHIIFFRSFCLTICFLMVWRLMVACIR